LAIVAANISTYQPDRTAIVSSVIPTFREPYVATECSALIPSVYASQLAAIVAALIRAN
jgi:hypothetical protein